MPRRRKAVNPRHVAASKQRQALRAGLPPMQRSRKPYVPDPSLPRCPTNGKLGYKTMERAEEALRDVLLHGSSRQVACRTYQCPDCGYWHLTSSPRRESR